MVNLVGAVPPLGELLALPGAHVHLYGKQPRAGRKVGHVTLVDPGRGDGRAGDRARGRRLSCRVGSPLRCGGGRGVRAEVRVAAVPVGDVRVALGRRDVGVPEHLLDAAQVGAALEEVGRERVAQEVRVDAARLETGPLGEAAQDEERARRASARRRGR